MLLETLSTGFEKALKNGNSTAGSFTTQTSRPIPLGVPLVDGFAKAGAGGMYAPNRVFVAPYCEGAAGSQFSMRVYGWRVLDLPDLSGAIFFPFLLVELLCTAGAIPGIKGLYVKDTENLCEVLSVTRGQVGPWYGTVNSPGSGTGLAAYALIDIVGCKYYSFDFARISAGISMNCLHSRA